MADEPLIEEGDHTVPADLLELYVALEARDAGCFDPSEDDDAPDR